MKRGIILVIDACGCGAMPDHADYNDVCDCNTLGNALKVTGGCYLPNFQSLGLANIIPLAGTNPVESPKASFGMMQERSQGKDTTVGHWEIAGLILEDPFRTYPNGFPDDVLTLFIEKTGCQQILGNIPASGTKIIADLGEEHQKTGYPIVYTSADPVFQIACHVETTPLEELYRYCQVAREILTGEHNVSRVIARPFEGTPGNYKRLSAARRDFSVEPPQPTLLNMVENQGGRTVCIGKIEDIFVKSGVTHAVHTGSNTQGLDLTLQAIENSLNLKEIAYKNIDNSPIDLIFTNLVDTDMLYGHRNDPQGFCNAIREIDSYLPKMLEAMTDDDLLIITADHGCDPTTIGTDHTREYVPVLVYNKSMSPKALGIRDTFADVGATIAAWLGIDWNAPGTSML